MVNGEVWLDDYRLDTFTGVVVRVEQLISRSWDEGVTTWLVKDLAGGNTYAAANYELGPALSPLEVLAWMAKRSD